MITVIVVFGGHTHMGKSLDNQVVDKCYPGENLMLRKWPLKAMPMFSFLDELATIFSMY